MGGATGGRRLATAYEALRKARDEKEARKVRDEKEALLARR
jgi:hypothetical protein